MSQLMDCKLAALEALLSKTGQVNDLELEWLQANGATSDNLNDAWMEMLAGQGFTGQRNDAAYAWWGSYGYTGAYNDREFAFWCIGGGVVGPGVSSLTIEDANRNVITVCFNGVPGGTLNGGVTYTIDGGAPQAPTNAAAIGGNCVDYTVTPDFVYGQVVRWQYTPGDITVDGEALPTQDRLVGNQIIQVPVYAPPITPGAFTLFQGQVVSSFVVPDAFKTGGAVTSYSAANLPNDLDINTTTGEVFGTALDVGVFGTVEFFAYNSSAPGGVPTGFISVEIVSTLQPPTYDGLPIADINAVVGEQMGPISVASHFTGGDPVNFYTLAGNPVWMTINGSGEIEGVPPSAGTFSGITVTAGNGAGNSDPSNAFSVIAIELNVLLHLPLSDGTGLIDFEGTN